MIGFAGPAKRLSQRQSVGSARSLPASITDQSAGLACNANRVINWQQHAKGPEGSADQAMPNNGHKAIDREAVKTLAIAVGVREAARQMGIPESTVKSWSTRGAWFKQPILPPTLTKPNNASTASKTPSDALADTLRKRSGKTKLHLSKFTLDASKAAARSKGDLKLARSVKEIAQTASLVHQWEGTQSGMGPISFQVLAQRAYFQTGQSSSET